MGAALPTWDHISFLFPLFDTHYIFLHKERKKVKLLSLVRFFATPWTVAYKASPSMGFSRQEYWSGLPFPSPGDLPTPGIEPRSPAFQADALTSEPRVKPTYFSIKTRNKLCESGKGGRILVGPWEDCVLLTAVLLLLACGWKSWFCICFVECSGRFHLWNSVWDRHCFFCEIQNNSSCKFTGARSLFFSSP